MLAGGALLRAGQREEIAHRELVEDIIDFLEIQHIRKKVVGTLAYGLQKRVELARALALEPRLLLLDEPMAGMNAEEKEDMARFILDINEERGTTMVMIEHDMGVVMDLSHRVTVPQLRREDRRRHARGGPGRPRPCRKPTSGEPHGLSDEETACAEHPRPAPAATTPSRSSSSATPGTTPDKVAHAREGVRDLAAVHLA